MKNFKNSKPVKLDTGLYWDLVGEALLQNSPYKTFPKNYNRVIDWASLASFMIEKEVWTEEVIKVIASFANGDIPQFIDIRHGKIIVVGGMSKDSSEGKDLLEEVLEGIGENDYFFKVKDGKILSMEIDKLGNMIGQYTFQN